jgi:hypothetical protein
MRPCSSHWPEFGSEAKANLQISRSPSLVRCNHSLCVYFVDMLQEKLSPLTCHIAVMVTAKTAISKGEILILEKCLKPPPVSVLFCVVRYVLL